MAVATRPRRARRSRCGPAPAGDSTGSAASPTAPEGAVTPPAGATPAAPGAPSATRPAGTPQAAAPSPAGTAPASPATRSPGNATGSTPAGGENAVTPAEPEVTSYRVTEIQLSTYPYAPYLKQTTDPEREDYPVLSLDRTAYEAAAASAGSPQPEMKTYRLLVLENRYLRLGILPDLGGRIYECIFKPTGANEFYANPVVKPTTWGPPSPPYPAGANWWLGTGGLEWGFPVEEHGYEFGTVWGFDHASAGRRRRDDHPVHPDRSREALCRGRHHPAARHRVLRRAAAHRQSAGQPVQVQVLGQRHAGARARRTASRPTCGFIFPANQVTVHSTGDPSAAPGRADRCRGPSINGKDMSQLGNWQNYLGVFATPPTATPGNERLCRRL